MIATVFNILYITGSSVRNTEHYAVSIKATASAG
jgi:hypothetical protein